MPLIYYEIFIQAPMKVCFDLARNVEVHQETTPQTDEKAVGGVTSGLLEVGDRVTFEGVHFGVKQRLTSQIIAMDAPYRFVDRMVKGAFHSFTHTHTFIERENGTMMIDEFDYKSPLGIVGVLADKLFLEKYMQRFIEIRAQELKRIAEEDSRCE